MKVLGFCDRYFWEGFYCKPLCEVLGLILADGFIVTLVFYCCKGDCSLPLAVRRPLGDLF